MKDLFGRDVKKAPCLSDKFLAPPFTVLDTKQGYWKRRKQKWLNLGIKGEEGRAGFGSGETDGMGECMANSFDEKYGRKPQPATSVFDPVLCELVYRWFCPTGGKVLDPFAGESTKGLVAALLGYKYTGVEVRKEQVAINRKQANTIGVKPKWVCGDSTKIQKYLNPKIRYDLIFTSPPYYNLEVYSKNKKDGSTVTSYADFMVWYANIFKRTAKFLKPNRFLVVKVGEVRGADGAYYNFVGDTTKCLMDMGLHYYNEAILVTPIGTLPLRAGRQFNSGRKLGKGHQNVLVFWKGDPKKVKSTFDGL